MCGYLGVISTKKFSEETILNANRFNTCRGPDEKIYKNFNNNFSFSNSNFKNKQVFNRLSIVELTNFGSQPMFSEIYNTSILFNGEIFNHKKLRDELVSIGVDFQSKNSDTEVLLYGLSIHGLGFVEKLIGQFSITFFDYKNDKVYLIRDRLGQKPLFYYYDPNNLFISSNLKSILKLKKQNQISKNSLYEYLELGAISSPNTLFDNIFKLCPGEIIEFKISSKVEKKSQKIYWNIEEFVNEKKFDKKYFLNLLNDAIKIRSTADVPIACFLSGGIDSSSIVKILSDMKTIPNTYSISHSDNKYDESYWFNQVVEKYKTNHITEEIKEKISTEEVLESIKLFDEPYADPSIVPSSKISKKISKKYKTAISGDGGDELLAGYLRIKNLIYKKKHLNFLKYFFRFYPALMGTGNFFLKNSSNTTEAYSSYFCDKKLLKLLKIKNFNSKNLFVDKNYHDIKNLLISDYKFYLSEMMLVKVDRTSMAFSLEVRSPFLDHRLIEYILNSDSKFLIESISKKLLKELLLEDFSEEFTSRSKMGFIFNLENWVFNNKNLFKKMINENSEISDYVNIKNINKLFIFETRMNANRLWKIFIIETYLKSIKSL